MRPRALVIDMGVIRLLRSPSSPELSGSEDPSDAELVLEAREGSRTAQEGLFRRHVRRMSGLAQRLLSGPDHDVDDVVQDAFVAAFQGLRELREPKAFGSWLGSILVRTVRKKLRREALLRRLGLRSPEPPDLDDLAMPHLPPEVVIELKALYSQLDRFPAEERVALVLKRIEGMEILDIAEHLGVSVSTAKRRLRRAEARVERFQERRT